MGTRRISLSWPNAGASAYLQADEISTNPAGNTSVVQFYIEVQFGGSYHNGPATGYITDATGARMGGAGVN